MKCNISTRRDVKLAAKLTIGFGKPESDNFHGLLLWRFYYLHGFCGAI